MDKHNTQVGKNTNIQTVPRDFMLSNPEPKGQIQPGSFVEESGEIGEQTNGCSRCGSCL